MKPLHVLTFGKFLDEESYEIICQSIRDLYKSVTPKHRRNLRITIVDDFERNAYIWKKAEKYEIEELLTIVNKDIDDLDATLKEMSILLMPGDRIPVKLITKTFSYGIPIIGYHHLQDFELVDQTCSMLIRYRNRYQTVRELIQMLKILYFDPEVRKILKRGTLMKYQSHYRWGMRERV